MIVFVINSKVIARVSGFENNSKILYSIKAYMKDFETGVRWNDPYFKIKWPLPISNINHKDSTSKDFEYEE